MHKYLLFLFTSHSLFALTTLVVSQSSDNNPGGEGDPGELRYCINRMNFELASTSDDYEIIFEFPMTIQLNGILPIINNSSTIVNITIGNSGSIPTVTIDGNSAYSGFFIPMGNVTIQNIIFQNLLAKGGDGGDGISGGGGGMGAGAAIYAPNTFLFGSAPSITLMNVSINSCSAIGGNGGNYLGGSPTGNEGGGGGGGFSGNGGSITTTGVTGGAGGGGFGGNGGDVTTSNGGGGGGGGFGSRADMSFSPSNLGNGGEDTGIGGDGSGYYLGSAGAGADGFTGGNYAGGGGGGGSGGGGGGSLGTAGLLAQGSIAPGGGAAPSGGNGNDGGGGGGGGIVSNGSRNAIDGQAGSGGNGGGGGGGSGTGASDIEYTVQGGSGGTGGGGGGGGVDISGSTSSQGGDSLGGGGGGGGGPSQGSNASGGSDTGSLGGGSGGMGAEISSSQTGGGGGGGSAIGAAIFIDSGLNLTIQAMSGTPTIFNTSNNTTTAGVGGSGGVDASPGMAGSALGNSIFLRTTSSLTLMASDVNDLLTLGEQVSFTDDTTFGGGDTTIYVQGNGTVIYNGTTDYQGFILINNTNFKVNGQIDNAPISVCRNISFSSQRGTLSGVGTVTGDVFANSGVISPDSGGILTLGSLSLSPAILPDILGSLVHIEIDSTSTPSTVAVNGAASLAGNLEMAIDPNAEVGTYIILTSSGITGTFDVITFTGPTPNYSISYLPIGSPTYVQFDFLGFPSPPHHHLLLLLLRPLLRVF